jgi:hypothetical protein
MSISQPGNLARNLTRVPLPAEEDLEKDDVKCLVQVAEVLLFSEPSR